MNSSQIRRCCMLVCLCRWVVDVDHTKCAKYRRSKGDDVIVNMRNQLVFK